jgi:RNA polymerase sigma-70 factor (ECF subfamily)
MDSTPTEQTLIDAQNGHQAAFEEVLNYCVALAFPFLKRHFISDIDCDDIIQNILIGVHKSLPTYPPKHSVKAWVFAIIRYKLMDFFRQKYHTNVQEWTDELDVFLIAKDLDDGLIGAELKEQIEAALSKLNQTQQQIIRMMKFEDLSIKEVASRLGLSQANVKVIACRGYKKLANILGKNPMFFEYFFLFLLLDLWDTLR